MSARCPVERWLQSVAARRCDGSVRRVTWQRLHGGQNVALTDVVDAVRATATALPSASRMPEALLRRAEVFIDRYEDGRMRAEDVVGCAVAFADLAHCPTRLVAPARRVVHDAALPTALLADLLAACAGWASARTRGAALTDYIARTAPQPPDGGTMSQGVADLARLAVAELTERLASADPLGAAGTGLSSYRALAAALVSALSLRLATAPFVRAVLRALVACADDVAEGGVLRHGMGDTARRTREVEAVVALDRVLRLWGTRWADEYSIDAAPLEERNARVAAAVLSAAEGQPSVLSGVPFNLLFLLFRRFPDAATGRVVEALLAGRNDFFDAMHLRWLVGRARDGSAVRRIEDPQLLVKLVEGSAGSQDPALLAGVLACAMPLTHLGRCPEYFEERFVDVCAPRLTPETAAVALCAAAKFNATNSALKLAKIAVRSDTLPTDAASRDWLRHVLVGLSTARLRPRSFVEHHTPALLAAVPPSVFTADDMVDIIASCDTLRVDLSQDTLRPHLDRLTCPSFTRTLSPSQLLTVCSLLGTHRGGDAADEARSRQPADVPRP